jgi:hypothetical protein
MVVWEELRDHSGSDRRNLVESHSTYANIKKAHTSITYLENQRGWIGNYQQCGWPFSMLKGMLLLLNAARQPSIWFLVEPGLISLNELRLS